MSAVVCLNDRRTGAESAVYFVQSQSCFKQCYQSEGCICCLTLTSEGGAGSVVLLQLGVGLT